MKSSKKIRSPFYFSLLIATVLTAPSLLRGQNDSTPSPVTLKQEEAVKREDLPTVTLPPRNPVEPAKPASGEGAPAADSPTAPIVDARPDQIREAALSLIPVDRHYRELLADSISLIYSQNTYLPIWEKANLPERINRSLSLQLVGHAMPELMALDPQSLETSVTDSPVSAKDLAITVAVADCAALIRFGAVPTEKIWKSWNEGDTPGDDGRTAESFAADFRKATVSGPIELETVISTLAPGNWIYRKLQAEYANARKAILKYSGLPNIPDPSSSGVAKPGQPYPYAPALAAHLVEKGYLTMAEAEMALLSSMGPELTAALTKFQEDYGLEADGIMGSSTWEVLNTNPADRFRSITVNMHRARLLPRDFGDRYLIVNLPSAELFMFEKGDVFVQNMRVVHGKASKDTHHTPVFRDVMQEIVFGPYWNVPKSIAVKEILPKAAADWGYLSRNRYEIVGSFSAEQASTFRLSPDNLEKVANGQLFFRQLPGPTNALGRIKFLLPNTFNVYLHDTPSKSYFARSKRDHSHGCVRVSKPEELGKWVLGPQGWEGDAVKNAMFADQRKSQYIQNRVNVFIVYFTTFPRPKVDGTHILAPARDVYELDVVDAKTLQEVVPWKE